MQRVAVDTSFLIFMAKRRIGRERVEDALGGPVQFYTSQGVLRELNHISRSARSSAPDAALALALARTLNMQIIPSVETPDKWLLKQPLIATVDLKLARKARERGVSVISITKSNRIVIT